MGTRAVAVGEMVHDLYKYQPEEAPNLAADMLQGQIGSTNGHHNGRNADCYAWDYAAGGECAHVVRILNGGVSYRNGHREGGRFAAGMGLVVS